MHSGETIYVKDYFGEFLRRVVVEWDVDHVFVSHPDEWQSAKQEKRSPVSIGFPRESIEEEGKPCR